MRPWLRFVNALDHLRFYAVLWAFALLCLTWSLPAGLLYRVLPRPWRAPVGQFGIMAGFRMYLVLMRVTGLARFDLRELDALRRAGPIVIAPNHLSLIDVVLIVSRLPNVVCITKASLWDNVLLGGGIRLAGYIRNDASLTLIRAASQSLKAGNQLLIFPEGTRSDGGRLGAFKGGFAAMARQAGVPVQTVFLQSNSQYLRRGWKPHRKPDFPLIYQAKLGRRFMIQGKLVEEVAGIERYFTDVQSGRIPM